MVTIGNNIATIELLKRNIKHEVLNEDQFVKSTE